MIIGGVSILYSVTVYLQTLRRWSLGITRMGPALCREESHPPYRGMALVCIYATNVGQGGVKWRSPTSVVTAMKLHFDTHVPLGTHYLSIYTVDRIPRRNASIGLETRINRN